MGSLSNTGNPSSIKVGRREEGRKREEEDENKDKRKMTPIHSEVWDCLMLTTESTPTAAHIKQPAVRKFTQGLC